MGNKIKGANLSSNNLLLTVAILIIVVLGVYNFLNNADFLNTNIGVILTLLIAVGFAYFSTQRRLDERKKKDQIEYLLQKMQKMLLANIVTDINSKDDLHYNTMFQKSFGNRISILKRFESKLIKTDNLEYLCKEFEDYKNFIGDNYSDLEHLKKSKKQLTRLIENIDFKLDELILSLYLI